MTSFPTFPNFPLDLLPLTQHFRFRRSNSIRFFICNLLNPTTTTLDRWSFGLWSIELRDGREEFEGRFVFLNC